MCGLTAGVLVLAVAVGSPQPSETAGGPGQTVICAAQTHVCIVTVTSPPTPGAGQTIPRQAGGANNETPVTARPPNNADPCTYRLADPQPPFSDPVWQGHSAAEGAIYEYICPLSFGTLVARTAFRPNGAAGVTVTPAQLAQQAVAQVKVPEPTFERSPSAGNSDRGVPYTWVNLWTWFWTSPQTWRPVSRTARVGPVWATVTARPDRLVFDPGDGGRPVECAGPGRAWQPADGQSKPSGGGCGYLYKHVTGDGLLTATVSIRWTVTWVGSGGSGGALPSMTTSATSQFEVQQIQAVVVR